MRLINADALAMHLADWQLSSGEEERDVIEEAIRAINEAPTIDAVPVVRCKDCKWGDHYKGIDGNRYYRCTEHLRAGYMPTDFCSLGERKDNE